MRSNEELERIFKGLKKSIAFVDEYKRTVILAPSQYLTSSIKFVQYYRACYGVLHCLHVLARWFGLIRN